jgi:predicted Rossmann fold nucleotide-binding protein DprA/Smf involved in DNA uptake
MMPSDPPSLRGNAALLAGQPAAFFCSRSCPGDVILKAQDWANTLGPEDVPVISGFHTPVERDVLRILLRGGAPVIFVLARAVQGYRMSPAVKAAIAAGQAQIVSPFPPTQTRTTAATAEARNHHILTLCETVLIAHASPGGKTEAFAREALSLGLPLQTLNSPANANLIALGAEVI